MGDMCITFKETVKLFSKGTEAFFSFLFDGENVWVVLTLGQDFFVDTRRKPVVQQN